MEETTIFDMLFSCTDSNAFTATFIDNLTTIYQYDKDEIIEHRSECGLERGKLWNLRLKLFDILCETFPDTYEAVEIYNRKKISLIAEDIYTIGYSVGNTLPDRRLAKVLKIGNMGEGMNINTQPQLTADLVEGANLLKTCVMLKDTVLNLNNVTSILLEDVNSLREKIAHLEMRLDVTQVNQLSQGLTSLQLREPVNEQLSAQLLMDGSNDERGPAGMSDMDQRLVDEPLTNYEGGDGPRACQGPADRNRPDQRPADGPRVKQEPVGAEPVQTRCLRTGPAMCLGLRMILVQTSGLRVGPVMIGDPRTHLVPEGDRWLGTVLMGSL